MANTHKLGSMAINRIPPLVPVRIPVLALVHTRALAPVRTPVPVLVRILAPVHIPVLRVRILVGITVLG
jgi:hypothetical protein